MEIKKTNTTTVNLPAVQTFKVEAGSKAFKVLSDSLYTDKMGAGIREIISNALDANAEAGKADHPIKLNFPASDNLTFSVRDFGKGLSEKDIFELYTTFFKSTKDQSNDFIGGFGIGSKSPFAYTNSFLVASYQEGIKKVYMMTLINDEPSCMKLSEEETEEENGLEVSYQVKANDLIKFQQKIIYLCMGLSVKPIHNYPDELYTWEDHENIANKFKILNPEINGGVSLANGLYVRIGQILYPAPIKIHDRYHYHIPICAVVDVSIGELELTASRETLASNESNDQKVKSIIKSIVLEGAAEYLESLRIEGFNSIAEADVFHSKWFWVGKRGRSFFYSIKSDGKRKTLRDADYIVSRPKGALNVSTLTRKYIKQVLGDKRDKLVIAYTDDNSEAIRKQYLLSDKLVLDFYEQIIPGLEEQNKAKKLPKKPIDYSAKNRLRAQKKYQNVEVVDNKGNKAIITDWDQEFVYYYKKKNSYYSPDIHGKFFYGETVYVLAREDLGILKCFEHTREIEYLDITNFVRELIRTEDSDFINYWLKFQFTGPVREFLDPLLNTKFDDYLFGPDILWSLRAQLTDLGNTKLSPLLGLSLAELTYIESVFNSASHLQNDGKQLLSDACFQYLNQKLQEKQNATIITE